MISDRRLRRNNAIKAWTASTRSDVLAHDVPQEKMTEACKQKQDVDSGRREERDTEPRMNRGRLRVEPFIDEHCRDLLVASAAKHGDLLAESGVRKEFLDCLLALDGFGVGRGKKEIVGETTLPERGANGRKQSEEGVRAKDVEITFVEVVWYSALLLGFQAGAAGLDFCSVGTSKVSPA